MVDKKAVGLNPDNVLFHVDHLAPICVLMSIPLLFTDESSAQTAGQLYPELETLFIEKELFTPRYLAKNFDVLFHSTVWHRLNFYAQFKDLEAEFKKAMRSVHCPHGFSDKVFWLRHCVFEDILLMYGNNMRDMFQEMHVASELNAWVRTGNYRYLYYRKHQAFFDKLVEERIWNQFGHKRPTILYAPTWNDYEKNTSLFQAQAVFEHLPSDYNLIVKLHPLLEEYNAPELYRILGKFENKPNIVFIKDWPLVFPILARSDVYIGDMSSVGYDFLAFNRPMFFLNPQKRLADRNTFLFRCGVEILPEQYAKLYSIIEAHLASDQNELFKTRSDVYHYTFGEPIAPQDLKMSIIDAYASPKKFESK
jgi:CDP-glycerol glycerophosphotransferase (TagB/SpsB family)